MRRFSKLFSQKKRQKIDLPIISPKQPFCGTVWYELLGACSVGLGFRGEKVIPLLPQRKRVDCTKYYSPGVASLQLSVMRFTTCLSAGPNQDEGSKEPQCENFKDNNPA